MGKYFSGAEFASAPREAPGCGNLDAGYVNDIIGEGCWAVSGQPVMIEDTRMSIHEGFELCNFNFRVDGTKQPIPFLALLPGPVSSVG